MKHSTTLVLALVAATLPSMHGGTWIDPAVLDEAAERSLTHSQELLPLFPSAMGLPPKGYDPNQKMKPNLLFIMCDQMRFDAMRHVQDRLKDYKDTFKIRTPNLDRLAASGVDFTTAYCMSPSCGPSRTTLRTGNTIQRTGVQGNKLVRERYFTKIDQFENKIAALQSYEQLLVENEGYVAETYGKWHTPENLYYSQDGKTRVIAYNDYDFDKEEPVFKPAQQFKPFYKASLKYFTSRDAVKPKFYKGQQRNYLTQYPYSPCRLDARFGRPADTPLTNSEGYESFERGEASLCGADTLSSKYSTTSSIGRMSVLALERLARSKQPWSLTVSFLSPHPPLICPWDYLYIYQKNRNKLFVPPSYRDPMEYSPYTNENGREQLLQAGYGYDDKSQLQELWALYYGLVEEVDSWVGSLLDKLDETGATSKTLVVFTSDHGELLGAHSMRGKSILLEEATRVPLLMSFPGRIAPGTKVEEPVSHLDVFSTVLDFLGASYLDNSDGDSLRKFIAGHAYNEEFDERIVVVETEKSVPDGRNRLSKALGQDPNFSIRKGDYKLIMTKKADSDLQDMFYDLGNDPYETYNLIGGSRSMSISNALVGKLEHLKILLVEWMRRHDGPGRYYSDASFNLDEGSGDVFEIQMRRKWRLVDYWQSDTRLSFGKPANINGVFVRNEYIYIGRTKPGKLRITSISVQGPDSKYFSVSKKRGVINKDEYLQIKISYKNSDRESIKSMKAFIVIKNNVTGESRIQISGER